MVGAEMATSALGKVGSAWLSSTLKNWFDSRKDQISSDKAWAEVSNGIARHTQALASRYEKLTTVAFPREPVLLDSIYVPLTLKSRSPDGREYEVNSFPSKLFESVSKLLIVDVAGMGKSTLSKIIYLSSLRERRYLPILIDLRRLNEASSIEFALAEQFGVKGGKIEFLSLFLVTQPLLFIFDGFDEVADKNKLKVARELRDFVDRAQNSKFVITSRPELPFSEYADFSVFNIKELNAEQARDLITRYGVAYGVPDRAKSLLEELRARHDNSVSSFLKNPLLTSLLFRAFEFKSVVPVKRGVFYRQVFDALYEAHDLNKETGYVREKRTGLHHDDFHRAVRALAKLYKKAGVVEVRADVFLEMASKVSKYLCPDLSFAPEDLLFDVTNSVPIFIKDGGHVRWAHKSLLDYFLSEFLLRDYSESKADALRKSAFGIQAIANENFLVLCYEADPILFSQAVTMPAIDAILDRYHRLKSEIPTSFDLDIADDFCSFSSCYECVAIRADGGDEDASGLAFRKLSEISGLDKHIPRFIYSLSQGWSYGIYIHIDAMALSVPVLMRAVPHLRFYDLARKHESDGGINDLLSREGIVFSIRKTRKDWDLLEDEFPALMGVLSNSDIPVFDMEALKRKRAELQSLVESSMSARSELF